MRLQKSNCTTFTYRPFLGETDIDDDGYHTGEFIPSYGEGIEYYGNINPPGGMAQQTLFGIDTRYTHVLLMDNVKADIREDGIIEWNGNEYDIRAIRPSLNVLSIALRKRTSNHGEEPEPEDTEEEESNEP